MKISVSKDLTEQRAAALAEIDTRAKNQRAKINTRDKLDTYRWKFEEALAWQSANKKSRVLANYPYLAAEVGITVATADALAQLWIDKWTEAQMAGPMIERKTQLSKKAVREAKTPAAIQAILDQLSFG